MAIGNTFSLLGQGATVAIVIKGVDEFSSTFSKATRGVNLLSNALKLGIIGVTAFTGAMTALGVSSIKAAANFEQTTIAFTTMLGSAKEAKDFLNDLTQFAKETPFTLTGVEQAARKLMAVGFASEDVIDTLKIIGDISSGLGLGEEGLQRIILNLGQVRAQGKLTGRELRDFAVAGIPMYEELSKVMGVSTEQIAEMVSGGEILTEHVLQAFRNMTGSGGRFEDLMSKQMDSVIGKFSNVQDTIEILKRQLGLEMLPVVKEFADTLLNEVLPSIKPLIPTIAKDMNTALKMFFDTLVPLIPKLIELATSFLKNSVELGAELLPIMIDVVKEVFRFGESIVRTLLPAVKDLIPILAELWENTIFPLLVGFGELVTKILQDVVPAIQGTLIPVLERMLEISRQIGPTLDFLFGRKASVRTLPIVNSTSPGANREMIDLSNPNNVINISIDKVQGVDAQDISESLRKEMIKVIKLN